MKISYAITVCNEFLEIQRLVNFLVANKQPNDEIVVQFDSKNGDPEIEAYLRSHSINGEFNWHSYEFEGDFSHMKNSLSSLHKNILINGDGESMKRDGLIFQIFSGGYIKTMVKLSG